MVHGHSSRRRRLTNSVMIIKNKRSFSVNDDNIFLKKWLTGIVWLPCSALIAVTASAWLLNLTKAQPTNRQTDNIQHIKLEPHGTDTDTDTDIRDAPIV